MRLVIQRVNCASVEVDGEYVGQINKGLLVFIGVGQDDTLQHAEFLANKLLKLKIFPDESGHMKKSVLDIGGELLLISQFTLYAKHKKNKLSFHRAMNGEDAEKIYNHFCEICSNEIKVEKGIFGAYMNVKSSNDGPVTVMLEKEEF